MEHGWGNHPSETHVSLGIMSVHPDFGGRGVGRCMVDHILEYTRTNGYKSCRLVGSAVNMDSFSLYNRCGFLPRVAYHDMVISVSGHPPDTPDGGRVRDARPGDVAAMRDLELEVSGIAREKDYRYAIDNPRQVLHASVCENGADGIDGFLISAKHPALHMIGPCVARS